MDGEFVREFRDSLARPDCRLVNGRERLCLPQGWSDATPKPPVTQALTVGTLTGFVHYCTANVDNLVLGACLVHVESPSLVSLRAALEPPEQEFRRLVYLCASTALVGPGFKFGEYHDAESFYIGLQTGFAPTPQRGEVLALVASIKESAVRETVDNGVSQQQVTVAGGVALVGNAKVPNPVLLQPYRTFREVEQPAALFVLRLRSNQGNEKPTAALFEADGGAWKLTAIQRVAAYLTQLLPAGLPVIA